MRHKAVIYLYPAISKKTVRQHTNLKRNKRLKFNKYGLHIVNTMYSSIIYNIHVYHIGVLSVKTSCVDKPQESPNTH